MNNSKKISVPVCCNLPEGDQWGCRVDQDKERDGIAHA